MNFLVEDFCLTYSSSALTRDSLTCVVILMPWVLLSALLHRSWRVHKSTAFVVWVSHELQPLQMSSRIRRCCSSLCMSQTVSSRCGRLRVFARAHVTFDSSIFYGVQNRMSCCSLFSHLWHNQQWCSIRTFHGPQSERIFSSDPTAFHLLLNLAAWPRLNQKWKKSFSSPYRVPALPVKNLTGSGPVHPALAGEINIYQIEHIRKTET